MKLSLPTQHIYAFLFFIITPLISYSQGVGIGTTSPDNPFEVSSTTLPQVRFTNTDATDYATFSVDTDGQLDITTVDGGGTGGHITFQPDGNVGIGTTTPGSKLEIVTVSESYGFEINDGTVSDETWIGTVNSHYGAFRGTSTAHDFGLMTSNTVRFHIESGGEIGINTQTPTGYLEILNNGSGASLTLPMDSNNDGYMRIGGDDDAEDWGYQIRYNGSGTGDANTLEFITEAGAGTHLTMMEFGHTTGGVNFYGGFASTGVTIEQDGEVNIAGNLGVGTATPDELVTIDGGATDFELKLIQDDGYDADIKFYDGNGTEMGGIRYDDADDRFEIRAYNGGITDRIRLAQATDNIYGDGVFTDNQFGPSEWVIGQAEEADLVCLIGSKMDEDGNRRAIVIPCDHTNCPNIMGVVIPEEDGVHHGNPSFEYTDSLGLVGSSWEAYWKKNHIGLELTGFRYVKVIGKVAIGDYLVGSGMPGYAKAVKDPGSAAVLGWSTENFDGAEGKIWARIHIQNGNGLYESVKETNAQLKKLQKKIDSLESNNNKEMENLRSELEAIKKIIGETTSTITPK